MQSNAIADQDVGEFVIATVARLCNLGRSAVSEDTNLQDLGIDSLVIPSILARVEVTYHCEFTHEQTMEFLQAIVVGDLAKLTRGFVKAPAAAAHVA